MPKDRFVHIPRLRNWMTEGQFNWNGLSLCGSWCLIRDTTGIVRMNRIEIRCLRHRVARTLLAKYGAAPRSRVYRSKLSDMVGR